MSCHKVNYGFDGCMSDVKIDRSSRWYLVNENTYQMFIDSKNSEGGLVIGDSTIPYGTWFKIAENGSLEFRKDLPA